MSETSSDEEESRRKRREKEKEKKRACKAKEEDERRVIVIVHIADAAKPVLTRATRNLLLLNTKAGNAVNLKAHTCRAAAAVLLPPSLQFLIIKVLAAVATPTISVLNPRKKLAARKSTNDHTVVLYSKKEVLSCKTESN